MKKTGADDAVDQLPIRLMMSLAIIAAIVLVLAGAAVTLRTFLAEHDIETQCRQLQSSLSTLAESGAVRDVDDVHAAQGTKRVQTFRLPESLVYLSFGGDPDPLNEDLFTSELLGDGAVIVYKVEGGSKHIIWLPTETFKFREGIFLDGRWVIDDEGDGFVIRTGGILTLVFERVQKNHNSYILVHIRDGMKK